ncbi:MAG: outer membrane beta-barrel protein [Lewinellaceae bacterium]|nr:outer membrane beta-barrel protein [Lewinellaceae bacterium]
MRINTTTAILLTGFVLWSSALAGQRRFKAGIVAGVTASQIDGDASAGYNKVGLQGGLRVAAILKEKQDASVEIVFTQRGCRNEAKTPPYFKTTLNYIEVPVQWHYHDWLVEGGDESENFYRVQFNAGLSYARLLGYKDDSDGSIAGITPALPDLERNSFCFLVGASFYASKNVGFNFRYHRAINKLYKPGKPGTNYAYSLNEHFLAFQVMYMF